MDMQTPGRIVYDSEGFAFEFREDACNFVTPDDTDKHLPANEHCSTQFAASKVGQLIDQLITPIVTANCYNY